MKGTDGADVIVGSPARDFVYGLGGDDLICGRGDSDVLIGGRGNDRIVDAVTRRSAQQVLIGGRGRDRLWSDQSIQRGGPGADHLRCGGSSFGDRGDDTITSTGLCHRLSGGPGNDLLKAAPEEFAFADFTGAPRAIHVDLSAGRATGWGFDTIVGISNVEGSRYPDIILATDRINYLLGGGGADLITGGAGGDFIEGNGGNDSIGGGRGADELNGGVDRDRIHGGRGPDVCENGERVSKC